MKRDVAILDNGNYKTENKSEEDIRLHLCKLVTKVRKNVHRKLRREKRKRNYDKNPSWTNNIRVSTCGLQKRDEVNERKRQQRKKRRAIRNKPAYIPSQVSDTKSITSDVDLMRLACLEHGGNNLDKYDWGF